MVDLEEKAFAIFNSSPRFWVRCVDDTIVIIRRILLEKFTTHINDIYQSIRFTRKYEEGTIRVLDALIQREHNNCLIFTVFRKATHTDQYLNLSPTSPYNTS